MNKQDVQGIKEEVAQLSTRLDNIEGYFQNFDTTLNNHMNDYKREQESQAGRLVDVEKSMRSMVRMFNWGFWVLFGLNILVLGAGGALLVALALEYMKRGGT
ncbi:MAG: hemolysin XhlA family protein [Gammaproteobacteria bacterium]|nr:hemolysin XhlA family protein [Gammaproteobacteria bacterium]